MFGEKTREKFKKCRKFNEIVWKLVKELKNFLRDFRSLETVKIQR